MYLKVQGNLLTKDWIIDDDKIIYGNGKKVYDINLIYDLRIDRPSFGGDGAIKFMYEGNLEFLIYARADKEIAEIAFEYLQENSIDKILNEVKNQDIKMRCNVCGKTYCIQ